MERLDVTSGHYDVHAPGCAAVRGVSVPLRPWILGAGSAASRPRSERRGERVATALPPAARRRWRPGGRRVTAPRGSR